MPENECKGPSTCGWVESERLLAKTFDQWRAEFREILEDHRKDIQSRLEMIERRMELKSDKESVEILVRSINDELARHTQEIKTLQSDLCGKAGTESLWKIAGIMVALAGIVSGIVATIIGYFRR